MSDGFNWVKIGNLPPDGQSVIPPGKVIKITVQGKELFFANQNGTYCAGASRCPHAGGLLHNGWLNEEGQLVCPFHRYCFDPVSGANAQRRRLLCANLPHRSAGRWDLYWVSGEERVEILVNKSMKA